MFALVVAFRLSTLFPVLLGNDNESRPGCDEGKRKNEQEKKYGRSQVRLTVPRTSPGLRLCLFLSRCRFFSLFLSPSLFVSSSRIWPRCATYFVAAVSGKERLLISARFLVHLPRDLSGDLAHVSCSACTIMRYLAVY